MEFVSLWARQLPTTWRTSSMDRKDWSMDERITDARIIEARNWLRSDAPVTWDEDWPPEVVASLLTRQEKLED